MEQVGQIAQSLINDEFSKRKQSMINDIMTDGDKTRERVVEKYGEREVARVENLADYLVQRFNAPFARNFYLKVAWHLPEPDIARIVGESSNGKIRYPARFASYAFKKELTALGIN